MQWRMETFVVQEGVARVPNVLPFSPKKIAEKRMNNSNQRMTTTIKRLPFCLLYIDNMKGDI